MPGDVFDDLYIHTCTVVKAASLTTVDPLNPQGGVITGVDWEHPAATTTGVRCRLMSVSVQQRVNLGESTESEKAGTVVATHVLQMPFETAPSSLADLDSVPDPAVIHRIINVKDWLGATYNAGPFDILYVHDPSGAQEALLLLLKKVN